MLAVATGPDVNESAHESLLLIAYAQKTLHAN